MNVRCTFVARISGHTRSYVDQEPCPDEISLSVIHPYVAQSGTSRCHCKTGGTRTGTFPLCEDIREDIRRSVQVEPYDGH